MRSADGIYWLLQLRLRIKMINFSWKFNGSREKVSIRSWTHRTGQILFVIITDKNWIINNLSNFPSKVSSENFCNYRKCWKIFSCGIIRCAFAFDETGSGSNIRYLHSAHVSVNGCCWQGKFIRELFLCSFDGSFLFQRIK